MQHVYKELGLLIQFFSNLQPVDIMRVAIFLLACVAAVAVAEKRYDG